MFKVPLFLYTGLRHFTKGGFERASQSFDATVLERDLKGKTCAVTGANQGIGLQVSLQLARAHCTLYMVCRSAERGQAAVERVKAETGNSDVHLRVCDISSLASIRTFVDGYRASGSPLHVLVNNAGLMVHDGQRSADGHDLNFATNTLGTWALTRGLGPVLSRSSPSRVIFVSSGGALTERLRTEDMQAPAGGKPRDGTQQYAQDKRRQIAMAEWLAREWAPAGVGVYSMHPGWTETEGVKTSIPGFYNAFKNRLRTLQQGADTIVFLAVEDAAKLEPGAFYLDRRPQSKHLPLGGTQYSEAEVGKLVAALDALAAPALTPVADA